MNDYLSVFIAAEQCHHVTESTYTKENHMLACRR